MAESSRHIELFTCETMADDLRAVFQRTGHAIAVRRLDEPYTAAHLFVVDGAGQPEQALALCRRLRGEQQNAYTPILYIARDAVCATRLASLEAGADASLARPVEPIELLAQVQTLLRNKERHDQLASKAAETSRMNQRLQEAHLQIEQELELARRLQVSFLPQSMPILPKVRFAVKYLPCSRVGGDFYDIFRLDEKHLGFHIADAMGHGVPASLLTIFVKKGVRGKDISGQSYRLVPPNEVLQRLNRDLIDQHLEDLPFITMIYVLFNYVDGTLQFSRAGHPYPLFIPKAGKPILWQMEGSLLGVFETHFQIQSQSLKPGDKLLIYTDGMDGASFGQSPVGQASLLAAAERFRSLPIEELVERLASDLFMQTRQHDDLTVFGLEMIE